MPWEIDLALLTYDRIAKSLPYIKDDIVLDSCLNLSSYIINWDESKLSKEFFIDKYKDLEKILAKKITHNSKIYSGDQLYGHLDLEKESIDNNTDGYISICPDIWFSEQALYYLIEASKQIPNKYFTITPQIAKLWDSTWDPLVNPIYHDVPYNQYTEQDIFRIAFNQANSTQEVTLRPLQHSKYAGWFDLYNKSFYNDIAPVENDWSGYGGWDLYSMTVADICRSKGLDYQQYVLEGQTIYEHGKMDYTSFYKNHIILNDIPSQRENFREKTSQYISKRINYLINNKTI
jgi:hypothetical protein